MQCAPKLIYDTSRHRNHRHKQFTFAAEATVACVLMAVVVLVAIEFDWQSNTPARSCNLIFTHRHSTVYTRTHLMAGNKFRVPSAVDWKGYTCATFVFRHTQNKKQRTEWSHWHEREIQNEASKDQWQPARTHAYCIHNVIVIFGCIEHDLRRGRHVDMCGSRWWFLWAVRKESLGIYLDSKQILEWNFRFASENQNKCSFCFLFLEHIASHTQTID